MSARTNLVLDVMLAAAFIAAANPPIAGLAVHEWLGVAFGAALVAHVVLHWDWMALVTRRLFDRGGRGRRLNYLVDAFLFAALTATVLSGLLTSRHVLVSVGLPPEPARGWTSIHSLAANASLAAIGVHLGLHWNWIALNLPRLLRASGARSAVMPTGTGQPSAAGASFAADTVK